jgi:hypothetical protein
MDPDLFGRVVLLIFAFLLFISGIALLGWMFSYQAVLYNGNAFNIASPAGLLAIVCIIAVSGFYFFRISVELMKDYMRG